MLYNITHCSGYICQYQAHQLHWEMETVILCKKCSQVAGLIHKVGKSSSTV